MFLTYKFLTLEEVKNLLSFVWSCKKYLQSDKVPRLVSLLAQNNYSMMYFVRNTFSRSEGFLSGILIWQFDKRLIDTLKMLSGLPDYFIHNATVWLYVTLLNINCIWTTLFIQGTPEHILFLTVPQCNMIYALTAANKVRSGHGVLNGIISMWGKWFHLIFTLNFLFLLP